MRLTILEFSVGIVTAFEGFSQINLNVINQAGSQDIIHNYSIPDGVTTSKQPLEKATARCYHRCSLSPTCQAFVTFDYSGSACALFTRRFFGIKLILENNDKKDVLAQGSTIEDIEEPVIMDPEIDMDIYNQLSYSIEDGLYYAYNLKLPRFPSHPGLKLTTCRSNGLKFISEFDAFESEQQWGNELRSHWFQDDRRDPGYSANGSRLPIEIENIIKRSFQSLYKPVLGFTPDSKFSFSKEEVISAIRQILRKKRIDEETVYANLAAIMTMTAGKTEYYSLRLTTLEDVDIGARRAGEITIIQPLQLSQNQWVVLRWNSGSSNKLHVYSAGPMAGNPLKNPIIDDFITRMAENLRIPVPRDDNTHLTVVKKCPGDDMALCAMHIFATWTFGDTRENTRFNRRPGDWKEQDHPYPDLTMPEDDFRLWTSYVMMRRYGLNADDIDGAGLEQFRGKYFTTDVSFRFHPTQD